MGIRDLGVHLVGPLYLNRTVIVALFILIGSLLLDISLVKVSDLIRVNVNYSIMLPLFVFLVAISMVCQYIVLRLREVNGKEIRLGKEMALVSTITRGIQLLLITLILIVTFQVLSFGRYSTELLLWTTVISYGMSVALLTLLAIRFMKWFKLTVNYVVLAYGISAITLMVNGALTLILTATVLTEAPAVIGQHTAMLTRIIVTVSPAYALNQALFVSSIISFISTWFATVLLLRHYSVKFGRIKYWVLVTLPLAYFIIQFPPFVLEVFSPLLISNPTLFSIMVTLTFALSKPVGGVLFALAFFFLARSLPHGSVVRRYIVISAFGLILLFLTNQALVWVYVPYPPFGMATIPIMGLCSYLFLMGISSSALSIGHDSKLRRIVRNYALQQSHLLESIGAAEMENEALNRAFSLSRSVQDSAIKETGIDSSVNENDIKDYVREVIKEITNIKDETKR
jgi:hypothetical protein